MVNRISILILCGMFGTAAQAYELDVSKPKPNVFGYNYVEAGYVTYNDLEQDGLFLDGSYNIIKNLNFTVGYSSVSGDTVGGNGIDVTNFQLGVGYHFKWDFTKPKHTHDLLKRMDVNALLGVESTKTTIDLPVTGSQSDAEAGIYTGAKFRNQIVPKVEVAAALTYHSGYDGYFILSVEGLYEITRNVHLRLSSDHQDKDPFVDLFDNDSLALSVRYNFL